MGGEAGADPQPVPRSPLACSRRRGTTAVLGAPLVVLTGASVVGNLLAPGLLTAHPLLLVALAPRTPFLAAAAGSVPFAAFVGVAGVRLCAADPWHFLLGRLHGERAAAALDRLHRTRRPALVALWDRLGLVLVAVWPTGKVLLLAGASRLPHRRVAVAAVTGTLAQVVLLYVAGRAVAGPGQALARAMAGYGSAVFVVTAGAVAGTAALGWRRRRIRLRSAGLALGADHGLELQAPVEDLLEQLALPPGPPQLHLQVAGAGHADPHP